mmetsp:Transcript_19426/g.40703  ORF Transcript_19426/g.40703 Transcript_19426/m.40703 type:complete len:82 (-) Transcript_19426:407-652(-)
MDLVLDFYVRSSSIEFSSLSFVVDKLIVAYTQRRHHGVKRALAVLTKTIASLFVPPPPLHHVDEVVVTSCFPSFAVNLFLD